jgi:RHS repeat-associated protein
MTRPNSVTTNYTYENLSRLTSVLHQLSGSNIDGTSYTLDAAGNGTSKTDYLAGVTSDYTYDPIYELTQVTQGNNTKESYSYDAVGNRTASLGVPSYTVNASNELTATSNATYTYDSDGNTLTKTVGSNTTTYAWDFENRLTSVILPGTGGTVTLKYDPFGRRIEKVSPTFTSIFAYDGDNLIETVNSTGSVVSRYEQTQNVDEPLAEDRSGTTSYYEADGLGSVSSLTSTAAALADTYTYDSFGNLTNSAGSVSNPFSYTAREFDAETGLYYYRARYYDPTIGRFLGEDPIGFQAGDSNFYRYVQNGPVNLTDPQGTCPHCDPSGHSLPPSYFMSLGQTANWVDNALNLISFRHGGIMDAQAYGGSPAYANYVFGVYMAAAGYSLSTTLDYANAYAGTPTLKKTFPFVGPKYPNRPLSYFSPSYPNTPAINISNIIAGFNDAQNGTLCTTSFLPND